MSARGGGKKPAQASRKNSEDMGTKESSGSTDKKPKETKESSSKGGAKASAPKKNPKK